MVGTNAAGLTHCGVHWTPRGILTTFADGTSTEAFPHFDQPHYSVIAHRCGYGDDLLRYCREHDVLHSVVAQWFWGRPSAVLWAQAHGSSTATTAGAFEELMVQTVQRFLRAGERPIIGGVDWDGLKTFAERVLGAIE